MKVTVNESETKTSAPFPKLMISKLNGLVVLFFALKEGIALSKCNPENLGKFCSSWDMNCFVDFNGSITLSND